MPWYLTKLLKFETKSDYELNLHIMFVKINASFNLLVN
jgi:hypothetical protein